MLVDVVTSLALRSDEDSEDRVSGTVHGSFQNIPKVNSLLWTVLVHFDLIIIFNINFS